MVDGLKVTCGLTACMPGSAPGPTLGNEYGKTLPFHLSQPIKAGISHGPRVNFVDATNDITTTPNRQPELSYRFLLPFTDGTAFAVHICRAGWVTRRLRTGIANYLGMQPPNWVSSDIAGSINRVYQL